MNNSHKMRKTIILLPIWMIAFSRLRRKSMSDVKKIYFCSSEVRKGMLKNHHQRQPNETVTLAHAYTNSNTHTHTHTHVNTHKFKHTHTHTYIHTHTHSHMHTYVARDLDWKNVNSAKDEFSKCLMEFHIFFTAFSVIWFLLLLFTLFWSSQVIFLSSFS